MDQKDRSLKTLAGAVTSALLLGGCPAPAPRPSPAGNAPTAQPSGAATSAGPVDGTLLAPSPEPHRPVRPRENHLSPAARSLVTQSRNLLAHGDLDAASSTLDRALRIEPANPLVWIELGRLRIAEGDLHQGETCGRKALALAGGDRAAQAQAGRLLADALRAQGRNQAAVEIERQPYMR